MAISSHFFICVVKLNWVVLIGTEMLINPPQGIRFMCFGCCVFVWQGNRHANVLRPEIVTSLRKVNERVVQISLTNSIFWNAHTFALTECSKLYAFGAGDKGQLGVELISNQTERANPECIDIDLS